MQLSEGKVMSRHVYNKVSRATPQLHGLEMAVCGVYLTMQCLERLMVQWLAMTWGVPSQLNVQSCVHTARREISIQAMACWQETVASEEKLAREVWLCCFVVTVHSEAATSFEPFQLPLLTFGALSHWSAAALTSTPSVTAPLVFHVTRG